MITEEQRAKNKEYRIRYLSKMSAEERRAKGRERQKRSVKKKQSQGYVGFACQIRREWRPILTWVLKRLQKRERKSKS